MRIYPLYALALNAIMDGGKKSDDVQILTTIYQLITVSFMNHDHTHDHDGHTHDDSAHPATGGNVCTMCNHEHDADKACDCGCGAEKN